MTSATLVALVIAGCGDNGNSAVPDSGSIDPATVTIPLGQTVNVTATFKQGGQAVDGLDITWDTNDRANLSVDGHNDGSTASITALGNGGGTVSAFVSGVRADVQVTVDASPAAIIITPNPVVAPLGATVPVHVTAVSADGTETEVTTSTTWAVDDATVASATGGNLTGVAMGSANLTGTVGNLTATVPVSVTAAVPHALVISPLKPSIAIAATEQFTATEFLTDGTSMNVTSTPDGQGHVTAWTTGTAAVATVSGGLATGIAKGTALITATIVVSPTVTITDNTTLTVTP